MFGENCRRTPPSYMVGEYAEVEGRRVRRHIEHFQDISSHDLSDLQQGLNGIGVADAVPSRVEI
jgi:hypothetical protein